MNFVNKWQHYQNWSKNFPWYLSEIYLGALFQKPSGIITDIYCLHRVVIKPKSWKKSQLAYPFYISEADPAFATPPIRLSLLLEKRNKKVKRVWGNTKHENHAIFFLFRSWKTHDMSHMEKNDENFLTPLKKNGEANHFWTKNKSKIYPIRDQ